MLDRFFIDKSQRQSKAVQTEAEQIALFKNYFESSLDAMIAAEADLRKEMEQQMKRNEMQKNKIELLEKKMQE